jgi:hypothetical protein
MSYNTILISKERVSNGGNSNSEDGVDGIWKFQHYIQFLILTRPFSPFALHTLVLLFTVLGEPKMKSYEFQMFSLNTICMLKIPILIIIPLKYLYSIQYWETVKPKLIKIESNQKYWNALCLPFNIYVYNQLQSVVTMTKFEIFSVYAYDYMYVPLNC